MTEWLTTNFAREDRCELFFFSLAVFREMAKEDLLDSSKSYVCVCVEC